MVSLIVLFSLITFVFSTLGFKFLGIGYGGWWKYKITDLPILRTAGCSIELPGCPSLSLMPGKSFGLGDHPFGQDDLGRDYFSLVMRGAERSIEVMVVIGLVAGAFGIIIGALAGFYRGWIDAILMRINDFIITIPIIVLGGCSRPSRMSLWRVSTTACRSCSMTPTPLLGSATSRSPTSA